MLKVVTAEFTRKLTTYITYGTHAYTTKLIQQEIKYQVRSLPSWEPVTGFN